MKRETKEWLKRRWFGPIWEDKSPAKDILDSHAAQARKIRELTAQLDAATSVYRSEFAFDCDGEDGCDCRNCKLADALLKKGKAKR